MQESFLLTLLPKDVKDSRSFFIGRLKQCLDLVTTTLQSPTGESTSKLIEYLKALKAIETEFNIPLYDPFIETATLSTQDHLAKSAYRPSDDSLASFQNRGGLLNKIKDVILQGSEKVIVITGMAGIGKTSLIKALFLKTLADWTPIWIPVTRGSSLARVVANIGQSIGVVMDSDALSTATQATFTNKVTKLLDSFFDTERNVIIIDDLRDIRGNVRDHNQLRILLAAAAKPKAFKGSRLILLSSITSPPLWMRVAGVSRIHLPRLEDEYILRVLEYQLRASGLVSGESSPDIPQKLLDVIYGHPFAAKISAEISKRTSLTELADSESLGGFAKDIVSKLLPGIELSAEEEQGALIMSIMRLPVKSDYISLIDTTGKVSSLATKGILDFDGTSYSMHPLLRNFIYDRRASGQEAALHKVAAGYYTHLYSENQTKRIRDINIIAELAYHLALAGDFTHVPEFRNIVFEELYPAARELYAQHRYDKALQLFSLLSNCRPNDPNIWAYAGRCHARRGQRKDSEPREPFPCC